MLAPCVVVVEGGARPPVAGANATKGLGYSCRADRAGERARGRRPSTEMRPGTPATTSPISEKRDPACVQRHPQRLGVPRGDQQPARRLRVGQDELLGRVSAPQSVVGFSHAWLRPVPPETTPRCGQVEGAGERRDERRRPRVRRRRSPRASCGGDRAARTRSRRWPPRRRTRPWLRPRRRSTWSWSAPRPPPARPCALPRLIAVAIKPGADRLGQEQPRRRPRPSELRTSRSASANPSATMPYFGSGSP